jgi:FdhD protein
MPRVARARVERILARRFDGAELGRAPESVLVEEPLEIRLDGTTVATTMRTPGNDYELAAGWCWSEGLLHGAPVTAIRYCATGSAVDTGFNVVTVETGGRAAPPAARLTTSTSSCGICGTEQVDALTARLEPLPAGPAIDAGLLSSLPSLVRPAQELFAVTGGSHAAAAVDADGSTLVVREDIGRHNAADKVIGRMLLDDGLPATGRLLWISGRASFEMVQKAWAAGFAALISVSAPSSLAVDTAAHAGLVLVGFARDGRMTVYAGDARVTAEPAADRGADRART